MSSPMKAKGVEELGICGVVAAIANAIYNATGVRVRDYPIRRGVNTEPKKKAGVTVWFTPACLITAGWLVAEHRSSTPFASDHISSIPNRWVRP